MRILTLDPGKSNFAFCLAEVPELNRYTPPKVLATGFIENTIRKINNDSVIEFSDTIMEKLKSELTSGDSLFIERYALRGGFGGKNSTFNIELMNLMIGIVVSVANTLGVSVTIVTASVWKKWCNKRGIPDFPKETRKRGNLRFGRTIHERDCLRMLIYQWTSMTDKLFGKKKRKRRSS